MALFLLLIALLLPSARSQEIPSQNPPHLTFGRVLGYENVHKIVVETLEMKVSRYNDAAHGDAEAGKLEYDPTLSSIASERILGSEVPPQTTVADATKMLREGFGAFVDHLVEFAKKNVRGPILRLNKDLYQRYMGRPLPEQKCGEIPCNEPPCCPYCKPPKSK
ncbi:MAG TPA: hypothetical protein VMP12_00555 [Candidatus Sulfotelmatobacter sp.]|nr:hypothetical protein [Candidatus Sulfotelmatobacter sp.]